MKNWEQIKQTVKQTRTEKDQKIVSDELLKQYQEAINVANAALKVAQAARVAAYEAANADYYAARAVYDTELIRIEQEFFNDQKRNNLLADQ